MSDNKSKTLTTPTVMFTGGVEMLLWISQKAF